MESTRAALADEPAWEASLLSRRLRANWDDYELLVFDRLSAIERSLLGEIAQQPGFYGVLRPRHRSAVSAKAVDRDAALLFLTLREAAPLPSYVRSAFGSGTGRFVARMIADGILEIERGEGFVSGTTALDLPGGGGGAADEAGLGRLARLSHQALRYAERLPLDEPLLLSFRLYAYNRLPITPRWRRQLPDAAATATYLGIAPGGRHHGQLLRHWVPLERQPGWLSWASRSAEIAGGVFREHRAGTWRYKLYISPSPEELQDGFGTIVGALISSRPPHFKVGADALGLLRPDKIVAYFATLDDLRTAADRLTRSLGGIAAQGVPFSAEIAGDGLLSWGVDPPHDHPLVAWSGGESWRQWLTRRLACALLADRATLARRDVREPEHAAAPAAPWRGALDRLRLEGVDPETWSPTADLTSRD